MPQINVQPAPDYEDDEGVSGQQSQRRGLPRTSHRPGQKPFAMDYGHAPQPSQAPPQNVAVPVPNSGDGAGQGVGEMALGRPLPTVPQPDDDPAADYEDIPADYDIADDDVTNATVALTTAAVVVEASHGIDNRAYELEEEEVLTELEAAISNEQPSVREGLSQGQEGAATVTITGNTAPPQDIPSETRDNVQGSATPLMPEDVLLAAGASELAGRLTSDGNLIAARPHMTNRRGRKPRQALPSLNIGQELDEIYRKQKYEEQLLQSPTKKLTGFKKWKYERSKEWQKSKAKASEALSNFTIWNGAFKTIEGRFGSPVLAYFRFLKWLFLLDLLLAVLVLGVVILPQVLMNPATLDLTIKGNDTRNCSQMYTNYVSELVRNGSVITSVLDFFQGTGWMENTPVFMGYYFNRTYTNVLTKGQVLYDMSTAYLLAVVAYFLVSLFLMVRFTAKGMRTSITSSSDRFYKACNKVFCGWDFSLSERKAVHFKHNQIYQEYIRDIHIQRRKEKQKLQTRSKRCQVICIRVFINIVVIAILGAAGYLIFYMANESIRWLTYDTILNNPFLKLLVEFLPSLTVTVLNFLVPLIFQKLVLAEGYSPTTEIKITIFRSVTLRLASVAVLVLGVGGRIVGCDRPYCNSCKDIPCWETYFGQQFYKLVLLDFLTVVLMTFFVQFPRKFIVRKFEKKKFFQFIGYQQFEIPKEVLDIVYSQTLCWIGAFVSPVILCMTVLKLFMFFYIKKLALLNTCQPATRLFRASNSQSFFMSILLLSFVLCAIPVAFAVGRILPSQGCSPFRLYSTDEYYMFYAVTDLISHWPSWLQDIIKFTTSWSFYVPLIVVICLVIYFYVSVAAGKRKHIKILLEQLALEGKDKQYLLTQVREAIARGDFKKTD